MVRWGTRWGGALFHWLLLAGALVPTVFAQSARYQRLPPVRTEPPQPLLRVAQENGTDPSQRPSSNAAQRPPADAEPPVAKFPQLAPFEKPPIGPSEDLPPPARQQPSSQLPDPAAFVGNDQHPIDLATAMRLAGATNLQIGLAVERVCEAQARLQGAKALWLPSLNVGTGFNHHDGKIQDTRGDVLDVSRGSVFVGGGAVLDRFPLAGGSNGPARFFADLSLTDALFEPLAARQQVRAAEWARNSTFNDVLFQVAVAYLELSRSQSLLAIAQESVAKANEFLRLTEAQQEADVGLPADVARAQDELALRQRQVAEAHERIGVASAELARLLRLDPLLTLYAQEERPLPLDLVDPCWSLHELIAEGLAGRPECGEASANAQAAFQRKRQEELRPWLPNVHMGYSGGGFAGGAGSFIGDYGSRGDFDVLAIWQFRNLGLGNRALQSGAASRFRQANLAELSVRDQIAAEIAAYYHRVRCAEGANRRLAAARGGRFESVALEFPWHYWPAIKGH